MLMHTRNMDARRRLLVVHVVGGDVVDCERLPAFMMGSNVGSSCRRFPEP